MVVWQGITEGGTAVPVQITEEGKVVAIGETGPKGDPGEPGPPGPPGEAEWPPNPVEGAFLVWLNGEPTWYTEQPIPTPPGLAGPITEVSDNSLLTFQYSVDQNVFFQNVNVYAAKADGSNWDGNGQYITGEVYSQGGWTENTTDKALAFNGSTDGEAVVNQGTITWEPSTPITFDSKLEVFTRNGGGVYAGQDFYLNGQLLSTGFSSVWTTVLEGKGTIGSIAVRNREGSANISRLNAVRADGKILLDPRTGPFPRGQISFVNANTALLSRVEGTWAVGDYMKADASAHSVRPSLFV